MHVGAGAVAEHDREARSSVGVIKIAKPHVGLRIFPIGDNAAILDMADELLHHRMVRTHDGETVERDVFHKTAERLLHSIKRHEMIEMFGIDVGDDCDIGGQLEERAVGFIGLDHHPVAGAEPRIGAIGLDNAAIDDGRIEIAGIEQQGDQRRGGGLAVRARNGHAALEPHQFGQHLGAPHDRQALRAGSSEFRIVTLDGRRDDHHVGALDVGGRMTDRHLDALVAQAFDVATFRDVGARDRIAEIGQHLRDTAHADTADTYEMDRTDIAREFHVYRLMVFMTRSASRSAASIAPSERAACPMLKSFCGALARVVISCARRSGVNSSWRNRIPPPAASSTPALRNWSWSSAPGNGTRIAGRPMAASSATVPAPERDTTRCAAAIRAGRSGKKAATSQAMLRRPYVSRTRPRSSSRACWASSSRARNAASRCSIAAGTTSDMTLAPWLPPNTRSRKSPSGSGGMKDEAAAITAGRKGLPVWVAFAASAASPASTPEKLVAIAVTRGASSLLARPITAFCSWMMVGILR